MWRDAYVTWLITHPCLWRGTFDVALSCILQDRFVCVPWLIHTRDLRWRIRDVLGRGSWGGAMMYMTWPFHVYDMTYLYGCRDSFIPGGLRGRISDVDYGVVSWWIGRDSVIYMIWLLYMCAVTHLYQGFSVGEWENQWCSGQWTMRWFGMNSSWLFYMYGMTYLYVCRDTFIPGGLRGRISNVDYVVVS